MFGMGFRSARARPHDRDRRRGRRIRYEIADLDLAHAIRDLLHVVVAADCEH